MDRELLALIPPGFEEKGYSHVLFIKKEHDAIRLENEQGKVLLLCYEKGVTYELGEEDENH